MIKDYAGRPIKIGSWIVVRFKFKLNHFDVDLTCMKIKTKKSAIIWVNLLHALDHYARYFKVKTRADLEHIRKITGQ